MYVYRLHRWLTLKTIKGEIAVYTCMWVAWLLTHTCMYIKVAIRHTHVYWYIALVLRHTRMWTVLTHIRIRMCV